ncbi:MAG: ABC transporter permease, partial [Burkholderiales bacterium]|nr:ABC transporter permease [Burkholderiales bacterium]
MSDAGALSPSNPSDRPKAWADGSPDAEPRLQAAGPREWRISGDWTLLALRGRYEEFRQRVASAVAAGGDALWDLRDLGRLDTAGALTLWQGWGQKPPARLLWLPEHVTLFAQFLQPGALPRRRASLGPGLARAGSRLLAFVRHGVDIVALTGRLLLDLGVLLRRPSLIGWREISANVFRTGAQALPITALVGFLVGLTLSYLISKQLKTYGADIFVINILGLAV